METKNIPAKNYVILAVAIIFTVLVVFYIRSWYITTKEYYDNNSVILDVVAEIKNEEIVNYATDNPDFILYVSAGNNAEIKPFEKKFKKFILKNDLRNNILYLNLVNIDVTNFNNYLNTLTTENAKSTLVDENSSAIYIFKEGKIAKVMSSQTDIDKMKIVFQSYGIIEEND